MLCVFFFLNSSNKDADTKYHWTLIHVSAGTDVYMTLLCILQDCQLIEVCKTNPVTVNCHGPEFI